MSAVALIIIKRDFDFCHIGFERIVLVLLELSPKLLLDRFMMPSYVNMK